MKMKNYSVCCPAYYLFEILNTLHIVLFAVGLNHTFFSAKCQIFRFFLVGKKKKEKYNLSAKAAGI